MATSTDLTVLIEARSSLISSISTGEAPVLELEVRGKRTKFESTTGMLDALDKAIKRMSTEVAIEQGSGPTRNRARTRR